MDATTKTQAAPPAERTARGYSSHGGQYYIPDRMARALDGYINHGWPLGSFLTAVISNNLSEAVGRADYENLANLPAYVAYLYNEAPSPCWGSPEKMDEWLKCFGEDE
jgi:hypothetical protein